MSAVADDFVDVVLGPAWHDAAMVLQIVALGVPYRALALFVQPLVDGLGRPGIGLKNTLTTTLSVPAAAVAGLYWGLIGLCIASLFGVVLTVTINLKRSLSLVDAGYRQLLSAFFPSMLAAAIMYAAVLGAKATLVNGMSPLWRLFTIVLVGALVYGVMTVSFNRQPATHCLQLIRAAI